MKEGLYENISANEYHNSGKYDFLSAGGIRNFLKSPAHYKAMIDKDEEEKDRETPALLFGSAAHSIVLTPQLNEVVIEPDINKRTKEGKELYAHFKEENKDKIIVSEDIYETIFEMREVIKKHETASVLLESGIAESSGFWKHPKYGFWCKIRPDWRADDLNVIVDYKTAVDASLEGFSKSAFNFGYDIQARWYQYGMYCLTQIKYDFMFVVQEKTKPYAVSVFNVPMRMYEIGEQKIKKVCELYNECLEKDYWPAYNEGIQTLEIPTWANK